MEIGNAREYDLLAIMRRELGPSLQTDLDGQLPYDCLYQGLPLSIKHISAAYGRRSFKVKWTADGHKASEYIATEVQRCQATTDVTNGAIATSNYPYQLLVYLDLAHEHIEIVLVSGTAVAAQIRLLGAGAFTARTGTNQRGIEISTKALQALLAAPVFRLAWSTKCASPSRPPLSPIARRLQLLAALPTVSEP